MNDAHRVLIKLGFSKHRQLLGSELWKHPVSGATVHVLRGHDAERALWSDAALAVDDGLKADGFVRVFAARGCDRGLALYLDEAGGRIAWLDDRPEGVRVEHGTRTARGAS